ncbi:putative F-box/LRR-repeat protein 19-like protein [Corchorus olitorius]|uniref:F-box/LRR-repeat protein 19-like protein n=1 Tax=Corchorus olitorius TaxID=93759 RepID=A0A1R3KMX6_9ROSI|nr:putative F-box/LRR-repeat protein 19-like protein [Corchorus olitorius]
MESPGSDFEHEQSLITQELIGKNKNLVHLKLGSSINLKEVVAQISLNCKNFMRLGFSDASIEEDEALAIATFLPNITHLFLPETYIIEKSLVTILQCCKQLVHLDVSNCVGFFENDEEILKLASYITTFECKGTMPFTFGCDSSSDEEI